MKRTEAPSDNTGSVSSSYVTDKNQDRNANPIITLSALSIVR